MITAKDFVERWAKSGLREQQAAQSHFNELCQLVGHKTPTQIDPEGTFFTFEENVTKATGGKGRADVWYRGRFAWEYKGKHKNLDEAYAQLLSYKNALDNPPLLVVCDFLEYRIYPQWVNTSGLPFVFRNEDLLQPETRRYLTWLLEAPDKFLELRKSELEKRERITRDLADKFAHLADLMREHGKDESGKPLWSSMQIARFLTKLVFSLFVEDIDLMPRPFDQPVFRVLVEGEPETFAEELERLFRAMNGERPAFMTRPTPYFNGGIFADSAPGANDGTEVLDLTLIPNGVNLLGEASKSDWRFVNPTIFGTLFEGALDKNKRAQLGAHYTSEDDIRLVIEPVLMQPLYRRWDAVRAEAEPLLQTYLQKTTPRAEAQAQERLTQLHDEMMKAIESTTVLDPACGSGNFLYVSLRAMKDLEGRVRKFFEPLGLPFRDVVTPRQLYGIEKDEFAAKLAHVVVWIGYLQWRYEDEGVLHPRLKDTSSPHPRQLPHPILKDKNSPDEPDRIINADAIMRYDADGKPYEPEWQPVDVIVGNPPFLGSQEMMGEIGKQYVDDIRKLHKGRLTGQVDLVTYWFEKARKQLEADKARRVGLLATNSIRGGANRKVLERVRETGDIFMAWSDREWQLPGAAVRTSIIGFDKGIEQSKTLDGVSVSIINPDLTGVLNLNITQSKRLHENVGLVFQGPVKVGAFDIPNELAQAMFKASEKNREVIRPYLNGDDLVKRSRNYWIIDLDGFSLEQALTYEAPIRYIEQHIKPIRLQNNDRQRREYWWRLGRTGDNYKRAVQDLKRQIFTPRVAKHRLFMWVNSDVMPSDAVAAIAREDDYFFGVLHSKLHEVWSLRMGTWLGKGNDPRYTPTTTFETFPFPYIPGKEDQTASAYQAISAAAKSLHEERDLWLNPPDLIALGATSNGKALKNRTLTELYNALNVYRKTETIKVSPEALAFAPRLHELHTALDRAVCDAYGWEHRVLDDENDILRRLLALNLERA